MQPTRLPTRAEQARDGEGHIEIHRADFTESQADQAAAEGAGDRNGIETGDDVDGQSVFRLGGEEAARTARKQSNLGRSSSFRCRSRQNEARTAFAQCDGRKWSSRKLGQGHRLARTHGAPNGLGGIGGCGPVVEQGRLSLRVGHQHSDRAVLPHGVQRLQSQGSLCCAQKQASKGESSKVQREEATGFNLHHGGFGRNGRKSGEPEDPGESGLTRVLADASPDAGLQRDRLGMEDTA